MATQNDLAKRQGAYTNANGTFAGRGPMQFGTAHVNHLSTMGFHQAQHPAMANSGKPATQLPVSTGDFGGYSMPAGTQPYYFPGQRNVLMHHGLAPTNQQQQSSQIYLPVTQYLPHANFAGYNHQVDSPMNSNWASRVSSGEMPTLMTPRRDSVSSNEQDLPSTPYAHYGLYNASGVAVFDRSPSTAYAPSGAPSPSQMAMFHSGISPSAKAQPTSTLSYELQQLIAKDPPIPRAIPAPSSPFKPLDRSLENKNGETNVYIRGLLPETTDEMLQEWGSRFGDIQSSKSIIDMKTGLCKGFGFIKYHNFEDAENCIRGFHHLGYEVSFARESFYAKLKKFADTNNTNLYVSNIPRNMNEHELASVFQPHKVCSSRILRDVNGNGRGVGFARFESREACEEVIRNFNNYTVKTKGGEEFSIQIRYSDTHEQKMLKQTTAAARQYRAAEFEIGVMQARSGSLPPPHRLSPMNADGTDNTSDYGSFTGNDMSGFAQRYVAPRPFIPTASNTATAQRAYLAQVPHVNLPTITNTDDNGAASQEEGHARPGTPVVAKVEASSTE